MIGSVSPFHPHKALVQLRMGKRRVALLWMSGAMLRNSPAENWFRKAILQATAVRTVVREPPDTWKPGPEWFLWVFMLCVKHGSFFKKNSPHQSMFHQHDIRRGGIGLNSWTLLPLELKGEPEKGWPCGSDRSCKVQIQGFLMSGYNGITG